MRLSVLALVVLLSACGTLPPVRSTTPASSVLHGDPTHPAVGDGWVRTELYFGLGLANVTDASEARWRQFLDTEVTPRFPSGLTVIEAYGQWRDLGAAEPERLRSKLLVLLHPATAENEAAIEAIRLAWKKLSGDLSVLRVTQPAAVSF